MFKTAIDHHEALGDKKLAHFFQIPDDGGYPNDPHCAGFARKRLIESGKHFMTTSLEEMLIKNLGWFAEIVYEREIKDGKISVKVSPKICGIRIPEFFGDWNGRTLRFIAFNDALKKLVVNDGMKITVDCCDGFVGKEVYLHVVRYSYPKPEMWV